MIRHIVLNTLAEAVILRARIANRLGFPKNGVNIGNGIHASADESRTDFFVNFRKHPRQNRWALFVNDEARPHLRVGDVEEYLTSDWDEKI